MNCLINILSVEKQKSLINLVQNRDETFEQELESYKKLFFAVLDDCLGGKLMRESENGNGTCSCDDFCRETSDCYCRDICSHIYSVIKNKTTPKEIYCFFEGIWYCYHRWINADASVALAAFEALLKKYELISARNTENNQSDKKGIDLTIRNLDRRVFYRARVVADLKQYLGKMDMFHVPFTKRYNLRNERFSLTGQPVLYLGNSIPDLLEEMEIDPTDCEALKRVRISSFEFTNAQEMRIYDLRCTLEDALKHGKENFTKQVFYRNLLSCICSFQKRRELADSVFKEEYAIPQMLTQILRKNGYNGICYYSTKPFQAYYIKIKEETTRPMYGSKNLLYRENLAVFTDIDGATLPDKSLFNYDNNLFKSLEISMPISVYNTHGHKADELDRLLATIQKQHTNPNKEDKNPNNEEVDRRIESRKDKAMSIVKFYDDVFSNMTVNKDLYNSTLLGQMHIQLLLGILNRLLVEDIEQVSNEETPQKTDESLMGEPVPMVEICDIEGTHIGQAESEEVHRNGILHLAQVVFVQKKREDGCLIASPLQNHALLYHHSLAIDDEIKKNNFNLAVKKQRIGAFIHKEYRIRGQKAKEMWLQEDFEYVEVYLCDAEDDNNTNVDTNTKILWKTREELKADLEKYYSSMDTVYQQALMILLTHLKNQTFIGKV